MPSSFSSNPTPSRPATRRAFVPLPALPSTTPTTSTSSSRRPRTVPTACVQRVNNPSDFAAAMPPAASGALVVFSFVARNCRACLYASRAYARLARDLASQDVRFCEMDVTDRENQTLCRELGVDAVPMFQFYKFRPGGREPGVGVLDQVVGPREVPRVREMVGEFSSDGFDIEDYVFEDA